MVSHKNHSIITAEDALREARDSLIAVEDALQEARDSLEVRVRERTAKLSDANERLQAEIAERDRQDYARQKAEWEERRSEKAKSEERYRILAEAAQDLIFIFTPDARVEYINSYLADKWGVDAGAVQGRHVEAFLPPELAAGQRRAILRVCATGEAVEQERLIPFPGGPAWINARLIPIRDAAGNVASVFGVGRDVTDRRRLEERVRQADNLLTIVGNEADLLVEWCDAGSREHRSAEVIRRVSRRGRR